MWGLSITHQRSKEKRVERATERKIRYTLKKIVNHESFRDPIRAETVCMTPHTELVNYGYKVFKEFFSTTFVPPVDKGIILNDSRGNGARNDPDWYWRIT